MRVPVSVLTVVLDDQAGFVATAKSVVAQRDAAFQYVVKDGGSTDGTWESVQAFGDFVDVAATGNDGGIYQGMNAAVRMSSGRWVAFINAGDIYADQDALARLLTHTNRRTDIVYSNVKSAETGRIHRYRPDDEYWLGMTFDHQSCLIRRSLLIEHPFDETLRIAGDLDLFSRLRVAGCRFSGVDCITAVKPFSRGASVGYVERFPERYEVLMKHFGATHPVEQVLGDELRTHAAKLGIPVDPEDTVQTLLERLGDR